MMALGDIAAKLGLPVFPCNMEKEPLDQGGFHTATADQAAIVRAFHRSSAKMVGMPTGLPSGIVVIDVDIKGNRDGRIWLNENADALPQTRTHKTQSGGLHLLFRKPDGVSIKNSVDYIANGIDVRGDGGYIIIPPSPGYVVADDTPLADMPKWLISAALKPEYAPEPYVKPNSPTDGCTSYGLAALEDECKAIMSAPFGRQEKTMNEAALKIGALVAGGQLIESKARAELLASARSIASEAGKRPWTDSEIENKIRRGMDDGKRNPRGPKDGGARTKPRPAPQPTAANDPGEPPSEPTLDGFELTEDGIAQAFTKRHCDNLRYCHDTGAWFEWTGKRWREDKTRRAFSWARIICRELAEDTTPARKATLAKAATASAIERFAQSDQALAATSERGTPTRSYSAHLMALLI